MAPTTPPSFELSSPPLADVILDINKFSKNLMAQQLFLTLGLPAPDAAGVIGTASAESARQLAQLLLTASGKRYVLVAMVNHSNAGAARAAMDALIDWTVADN